MPRGRGTVPTLLYGPVAQGLVDLCDAGRGRREPVLVDFDDPTRQHTKYGFTTDGRVFYFTIGAPESDVWVAELGKQ